MEKREKMCEIKTDKKSIAVLAGLLLISCLCIFYPYLFGNHLLAFTDIGSDTYDQYVMHYQTVINHLREGSFSLWDFNNGFGMNLYSLNLYDPFLMLLYLAGVIFGPSVIYGALVWLQILRIILAGISVYCFLSCFPISERCKLFAAYPYALCGYMIVWGQHYQFETVLVIFPLLLMAAEKALQKTKWLLGLTLFCGLASIMSLYMSYMQFVVLGFYILFRVAWNGTVCSAEGIKQIMKSYGSMILGIGIGLFSLLPSAAMIFGVSGRVGGTSLTERVMQSLHPWTQPYYETLLKRFFSGNMEGINVYRGYSNYYEDPNVFLSALLILTGAQFLYFLFRKKYVLKQRLLLILTCVLFGFLLLIPLGSLIFNGFAYPFSRHTFLCMPFFVWMMAVVLQEMLEKRKMCIPVLILTAIIVRLVYKYSFSDCALAMDQGGMKLNVLLNRMSELMALFLFGAAFFRKKVVHRISVAGLALCLMGTMTLDAFYSYNIQRTTLEKGSSDYLEELYHPDLTRALAYLAEQDDTFYRVEKDYTIGTETSCLNALAQNYAGVSTYNSTLNTGTKEFCENFWPNLEIINAAHLSFANAVNDDFQASLSHVKYVLSKNPDFQVRGYERYQQVGSIYIYRNTHTQELGKFYTSAFTEKDYETVKDSVDKEALLAENIICDTAAGRIGNRKAIASYGKNVAAGADQIVPESPDGSSLVMKLPEFAQNPQIRYVLEFDLSLPETVPAVKVTAGQYTTELLVGPQPVHVQVSIPEKIREITISQDAKAMNGSAVIQNQKLYATPVTDLSSLSEGIRIEACEKDSVVQGTASVKEDGILMMAIPYERGWHAYVDGEETEIQKVNYGFSGVYLASGEHEIQMVYRCPGFLPGVVGSICFALLTLAVWGRLFYLDKRRKS